MNLLIKINCNSTFFNKYIYVDIKKSFQSSKQQNKNYKKKKKESLSLNLMGDFFAISRATIGTIHFPFYP